METARQKRFARIALIALTALGLLWLARLDYAAKISTNVIDLIPADERAPELALVRSLTDQQQARVLLLALAAPIPASGGEKSSAPETAAPDNITSDPSAFHPSPFPLPSSPTAAAQAFAAALKASPAIADAVVLGDPAARDELGRFVFTRRFDLLLPGWLVEQQRAFAATGRPSADFSSWLAEKTVLDLDRFLARPESIAFQELIPHDPLLLVPTLVGKIESLAAAQATAPTTGPALVWAVIKDSPFSEAGQDPVFAVIDTALAEAKKITPALELRWTGINRFAAESKNRIKAEISWLNTASLLGVLAIAALFVRRLWKILHLVPIVALSTLGAWCVTTMAFDRVHILVFVIGSLLAGVAIDYGFYLYMQPALRPDEPYHEKLRRLLKPLLTSCLTTVIGFSLLFWSELPLVRQLGVFVSAGLISALVAAILYFAQLNRALLETRTFALPAPARSRRLVLPLFILAALVALLGPWRLSWRDDIRELEIPAPALRANDEAVRRLFGDNTERTAYLTRGDTPAAARAALDRFHAWHQTQFPNTPAASAGFLLPTESDWLARPTHLAALSTFPADFRAALEKNGYTADSFAPFFEAWSTLSASDSTLYPPPSSNTPASDPTTHYQLQTTSGSAHSPPASRYSLLFTDVRRALTGPLSLLFHLDPAGGPSWFLTLADHPPGAPPPPELNTFSVAQLESLNTLFARYRADTARLSGIGLALIGLSVFVLYGLRRGVRIFMIPAGSCFFALGLLGLLGQSLNIFHLLAAFLGVCLSHNYAIFSAENANRREPPPPSIRLSALTTAVSFGVLALSAIPVVSALGSTVALIVLTALLMVELEPLSHPSTP